MSALDITILLFLVFWAIRGFLKGFASEIVSLVVWASSVYLSIQYFHIPAKLINNYVLSDQISSILTIITIFIITFIVAAILGFIFSKIINIIGLYNYNKASWVNIWLSKRFCFFHFFCVYNLSNRPEKLSSDRRFSIYARLFRLF